MSNSLNHNETLTLLCTLIACIAVLANTFRGDGEPLIASLALSGIAFCSAYALIRWLGPTFMRAGLKGRDMCKLKVAEMSVMAPLPRSAPPALMDTDLY